MSQVSLSGLDLHHLRQSCSMNFVELGIALGYRGNLFTIDRDMRRLEEMEEASLPLQVVERLHQVFITYAPQNMGYRQKSDLMQLKALSVEGETSAEATRAITRVMRSAFQKNKEASKVTGDALKVYAFGYDSGVSSEKRANWLLKAS